MSNSKRIKEKVHFYVSILAGAVQSKGIVCGLTFNIVSIILNLSVAFAT